MGKKYIKMEISKTVSTVAYVEVDEDDERFKSIFIPLEEKAKYKERWKSYTKAESLLSSFIDKIVDETIIDSMDWSEYDPDYETDGINPCEEEEAKRYKIFQMPPPSEKPSE